MQSISDFEVKHDGLWEASRLSLGFYGVGARSGFGVEKRRTVLKKLLDCRLTRRRINRYLDSDPARDLTIATRQAVTRHLDTCSSCFELERQHRAITSVLRRLGIEMRPDPEAIARLSALSIEIENRT